MVGVRPVTVRQRRRDRALFASAALAAPLLVFVVADIHPALAPALLLALAYAWWVARHPDLAALVCFAVVPVTAGIRRGLPLPAVKFSEALIVGTAVVIFALARRRRPWTSLDTAALCYVAATLLLSAVNVLLRADGLTWDSLRNALAPVLFYLLFRSTRIATLSDQQRTRALWLLMAPAVLVVLVAVAQSLDIGGVRSLVIQITDGGVFDRWSYQNTEVARRATGLFEIWHSLAGYLIPMLLLCVALLNDPRTPRAWRPWAIGMLVTVVVGVIASQTLNTLAVAVFASVLVGAIYGKVGRTAVVLALVGLVAFLALGNVLASRIEQQFDSGSGTTLGRNIDDRLDIWRDDYAEPLARYWLTGYGPALPPNVEWESTESMYITFMLRGGIGLLVSYLALISVAAVHGWRCRHSRVLVDRVVGVTVVAVAVGSVIMHLVFPYFTSSGYAQVVWLLFALLPGGVVRSTSASRPKTTDLRDEVPGHRHELTAGRP